MAQIKHVLRAQRAPLTNSPARTKVAKPGAKGRFRPLPAAGICYIRHMTYRLHYAPDNASLVIRLVLDSMGLPFETVLVDRRSRQQDSAPYRALNPNGLIPVLETPQGPMFETAAILLWLGDTHGQMVPHHADPGRGRFLTWLFWLSNTLHPDLKLLFYPEKHMAAPKDQDTLQQGAIARLKTHLAILEAAVAAPDWFGGVTEPYIACMLRWMALYPQGTTLGWMQLDDYPALQSLCTRVQALPATARVQTAEGLGPTPFTNPHPCTPPEGSPL